MRAAAYLRISFDPNEESYAIERQREDAQRRCDFEGWTYREYVDHGISAWSKKRRPAFEQLLNDLPNLDVVIVYRVDRLARQPRDLERFGMQQSGRA